MKKNNNKLLIAIIVLVTGLFVCVSINIYKIINNGNKNVIEIDDKSNQDKTTEKKEDKKDDSKVDNKVDDNQSTTNNNTNTNVDSNTSNTNTNNGSTSTNNNGNGTPVDTGTGTGNGSGYSGQSGTGGTTSSTTASEDPGKVTVSDSSQEWGNATNLKIFDVDSIEPGDHGTYDFTIDNNNKRNSIYDITFDENNEYSVNMLYKLKRNGYYIAGNEDTWVKYDSLNVKEKVLNKYSKDLYTIEWKWVDAENDTEVGRIKNATYKLSIYIKANETTLVDGSGTSIVYNPNTGDYLLYYIELQIISVLAILLIIKRKKNKNESV